MHQVASYLLTGLGGAVAPTVGITVLVGKNSDFTKGNALLEQQNQFLATQNKELNKKIEHPETQDVLDVAYKHYWYAFDNASSIKQDEKYIKYEEITDSNRKLQDKSKCLYEKRTVGAGVGTQIYHYHICLKID